ncbi:hypothetical protein Q0Z83_066460 [Actinoplanes sichuanensis]|uniref:Uncharacterized protein n=1 Tax=Actinoplanes sichuanensis TaxID=512349 RepID=A0ABW4AP91_9ACTN|nr:hypothetical protein [Actinoplanes sichuanensis]BEL08455.1 hypothetical protein Q0Z83_066460 [Actinoplanes sichuanensis]
MYEDSPWQRTGPRLGMTIVFWSVAVSTVAAAALLVVSVVNRDVPGVIGFAAGTVVLGHLVGFGAHLWWRPRRTAPRVALLDGAVTFRFSVWTYYWLASFMIMTIVALLFLGWIADLAARGGAVVVEVMAFGAAAFFGWRLLRLIFGGRGGLLLTPAMIEHHGPGFVRRLGWDEVAAVVAGELNDAPLIVLKPGAPARPDITPIAIRSVWLVDDPVIVYRTLRHYHANPRHRPELAGAAGADRIRQRRFATR